MIKKLFATFIIFACFAALTTPILAQDEPEPIVIPVSGTFDFFPESYQSFNVVDRGFKDAFETEVWYGDIVGEASAPFRMSIDPDGTINAWLVAEFEGTVVGEYEGTMVMVSLYTRPSKNTHWSGQWIIMSGTGDLENVQGYGTAWGPGFIPDDTEDPDIYYLGHLVLPGDE